MRPILDRPLGGRLKQAWLYISFTYLNQVNKFILVHLMKDAIKFLKITYDRLRSASTPQISIQCCHLKSQSNLKVFKSVSFPNSQIYDRFIG